MRLEMRSMFTSFPERTFMIAKLILTAAIALSTVSYSLAQDPQPLLLWPQGAPGALGETDADRPSITPWLAPKETATGAAVVVCPGGGYGHLAIGHEGKDVAAWLNSLGVSAFVLQYRL